jgi:hypothetical protein
VYLDGKTLVPRHGMTVVVGRHRWAAWKNGKAVREGEFVLRPDERKLIPISSGRRVVPAGLKDGAKPAPGKKEP